MTRRGQVVEHLSSVPLFAACAKGDLRILARHLIEVDVPEGVEIVSEGDDADAFYVVLEGRGTVTRTVGRSKRTVATVGPGSHFGELALLDPAPRNATITAASPMVVGVLGSRIFKAVLRDVPTFSERLLAGLARRLRDTDQQLVESDAAGRTARRKPQAREPGRTQKRGSVAKAAAGSRSPAARRRSG